ncbi:PREDICTED: beta-lactamase domain-containing protein 2-like [Priapulus caudatus]|uniref:Beta-lactamase domain-containing protein 2-like n=1 Tax=Priapulus caudatus TaxID=37621 RepID=A0ABM1E8R8_PRICU|nr:PREDICTED: beta-lactamase domain-containing protein 2-like [Priapulus caudatus]
MKNFDKGIEEYGAAFTVYHKGKQVVNLWGGWADKRACVRWQKDTMAVSFSATKGCAALCVAILVDQGYLCYDDQVTKYWPEFEKHGKDDVTVKQLLSHQAGLAQVDQPLTLEIMKDRDAISSVLEDQSPLWLPGTAHGYHILTHGMLIDQLLRRVDPKKRTVGQFFKDEVAEKFVTVG